MNRWKLSLLGAYYGASLPARYWDSVMRGARKTEPIRVMFYHRVADTHPNDWTISTTQFAAQIHWLRKHFDLVSLSEAQRRIASGQNHRPTACITFDDGYAENCEMGLPLLLQHDIPFTYFVSTDHVLEGQFFPHDVKNNHPLRPNSIDQLRGLLASGVEIGAHTRSHADLGKMRSRSKLVDEIIGSKLALEDVLQCDVRYFAFPYGQVSNLSNEAFQIAYEAGYQGVCSAYGGYNFPGEDSFHLRRFHADEQMVRFKNWMTVDPRKLRGTPRYDPENYQHLDHSIEEKVEVFAG